jgi:pantetheine-phosphate adenylyltransferase
MRHVVIGGTFDNLHRGHEEFIRKAFGIGDNVLVCLTSDRMVTNKPLSDKIESYGKRKENVIRFLKENGWIKRAEIVKIEDPFTEGLRPGLTDIVVSAETRKNAEKINLMRKRKGLKPLKITEIRLVSAEDGGPISDARIRKGEIGKNGKLL